MYMLKGQNRELNVLGLLLLLLPSPCLRSVYMVVISSDKFVKVHVEGTEYASLMCWACYCYCYQGRVCVVYIWL